MKRFTQFAGLVAMLLAAWVAIGGANVDAAIYTLTDGNSTVRIEPTIALNMDDWVVDGTDYLYQQGFWYRIGDEIGARQRSLDYLDLTPFVASTGANILDVVYTGAQLEVAVQYALTGGAAGSGASTVDEIVVVTNTGSSAIDLHFYQYADFDANGTSMGDSVVFLSANAVRQSEANWAVTEIIASAGSSHQEAKPYSPYSSTIVDLNNRANYTLSDTPAIGATVGPGDMTWAFQWDVALGAGDAFTLVKSKHIAPIVPEPATIVIWSLLGAGSWLGMRVWRRRTASAGRPRWSDENRQAIRAIIARGPNP